MSTVAVKVEGEDKVLANLDEMAARAKDARPATRKVRDLLVESERKTFESEGSHIGKPWAPLSEETLKRKEREGIDRRPLHGKTGDFEASLTGGRGKRTGATKTIARAGSGVWYGVFARGTKGSAESHNTGEPARRVTGVTKGELEEIFVTVAEYVVHGRTP